MGAGCVMYRWLRSLNKQTLLNFWVNKEEGTLKRGTTLKRGITTRKRGTTTQVLSDRSSSQPRKHVRMHRHVVRNKVETLLVSMHARVGIHIARRRR